jgi:WD40 repeat protein/peroxiredoxin
MWRHCVAAFGLVLGVCVSLPGADLAKLDRPPVKLPERQTDAAEYCLLVFGPEAAERVWLMHDGDVLYVDRNGNGDLTEPGERVTANPKYSKPEEGVFYFSAGEIFDGKTTHKDLVVRWININHLKDVNGLVKEQLERNPKFRGCWISVDVSMDGYRGTGIGGRVPHMATIDDERGLLQFSPRMEDAPVIHFGGPWQITLAGKDTWRIGRAKEVYLVVGTPGVGPGTTACIAYESVIPAGLAPKLRVTYPANDSTPITKTYELKRRCCQINLYGDVAVPDDVAAGTAKVDVSLESWPGSQVASTTHDVPLLPSPPGPKLEPVSSRLVSKLEHLHPNGSISAIGFSPDGRRVIAGDYPGGLVHIWDLASGNRLQTIDAGDGYRGSMQYFWMSPDWSTIIAPTNLRGKFDRVERDGKNTNRVEYRDSIRAWNASTGELLHTWQDSPPRGIRFLKFSPDGSCFFSQDELPGEFEAYRPSALSLWDTASGKHRQVLDHRAWVSAISPDSKRAAVAMPDAGIHYHESITVFELPEWKPTRKIPLGDRQMGHAAVFIPSTDTLVASIIESDKAEDFQNLHGALKFWSLTSGNEVLSIPAPSPGEYFAFVKSSDDGRTIVASTLSRQAVERHLYLVDWPSRTIKTINYAPDSYVMESAFHPSGKWLGVPLQFIPNAQLLRRDPPATDLPQPRIQLVDVATGAVVETLIGPQTHQASMAFSPDGNTLATSGMGAVLLWDLHTPPGQADPGVTVGQLLEAEGTLGGGEALDWPTYRGKVVLVVFWATWCKPCVAEIPALKATYEAFRASGFDVLGISLDDDPAKVAQFVKDQEIPWSTVCGTSADNSGMRQPTALKYHIDSVPKAFLVDQQGKVVAINLHGDELSRSIHRLLGTLDEKKAD